MKTNQPPPSKRQIIFPSTTESDESMNFTQTCPPTLTSSEAPSRQKRCQLLKQKQIEN